MDIPDYRPTEPSVPPPPPPWRRLALEAAWMRDRYERAAAGAVPSTPEQIEATRIAAEQKELMLLREQAKPDRRAT